MSAPAFTCSREILRLALRRVSRIIPKRANIPILSNVRIETTEDGRLLVLGTDGALTAETVETAVEIKTPGVTTVVAETLLRSVEGMPEGPVTIESTTRDLTVKAGRARTKMPVLPDEDFPKIVYGNATHSFRLAALDLTDMVDQVGFAICHEETRWYMNGIYWHLDGADLVAVATDGHRLSRRSFPAPDGSQGMAGVLVSKEMVKQFPFLSSEKSDEPITVDLSDAFVRFTTPTFVLTGKLVDGQFPDYQRVMPRGNPNKIELPLELLRDAVERLAPFAEAKDRTMRCEFSPQGLVLQTKNDDGEAREEMDVDCTFELKIGLNARYMLDLLKTIRGAKVSFAFSDPSSPPYITDPANSQREAVIMPVAI